MARTFVGQAFFGGWEHFCVILLACSPYEGGQWAGHRAHPNFGFISSLPSHLFWVCLSVVCVLVEGETLLHRACKRNQVETVLQILALPGTDVNVKGKTFSLRLSLYPLSHRHLTSLPLFALGFGGVINIGEKREEIRVCVRHH